MSGIDQNFKNFPSKNAGESHFKMTSMSSKIQLNDAENTNDE